MKKFTLISALFMALSPLLLNAQINQTPIHTGGGQIMASEEKAMAATGSMYLNEKYVPAKISGNDRIIMVRYNAYSDYFEIVNDEGRPQALPRKAGVNVTLNTTGDVYALQSYRTEDGENANGYLNVISDNAKVKIYKRDKIYLQPGKVSQNSYGTSKAPVYKKADDEFYVQVNNGDIIFVSGKKDIANLVPGKSKEVLDFIKKNKIDVEKETDLQQLSAYMETIL
ncbi:hypothetical protein [uncultured Flavobacterium sp.]|uniref:hypothetical protein n=1 Tax=uncultured Flavobacterium sp. TaxID=165435 RepID=UPI0025EA9502|nr:hypothetical protein [uncultured Flavobacterium sp.]